MALLDPNTSYLENAHCISQHHLPAKIPQDVANAHQDLESSAEFLRQVQEDPMWLAYRVLGQEGVCSTGYCHTCETCFIVDQGSVIIMQGLKKWTEEERSQVDAGSHALDYKGYTFNPVLLKKGEKRVLLAYTVYGFALMDDTMLTMGHIINKGETPGT
jgi:hypothetical protein